MAKDKIHFVEQSRYSFGGAPPDWLSICPVLQSERINPQTTTREPERVTCGLCLRALKRRGQAKLRGGRVIELEEIGVEGSVNRRLLGLMQGLGIELIDVEDLDHPSRRSLLFDAGDYLTRLTIEDLEKPKRRKQGRP